MGLLHRAIFLDLVRVFLLALLAITGIFVLAGVVQEASRQGLAPEQIYLVVPLLLPGTLPFTVPATTLFAVSVVYGRLAGDNEITAIKAAGIPLRTIIWPALLLGLLLSGVILGLYLEFIPHTHHHLRGMVLNNFENLIYARLRQNLSFKEPKVPYSMHVHSVQGRLLVKPIFKVMDEEGKEKAIIWAEEAELHVNLEKGVIVLEMVNAQVNDPKGQNLFLPRETVEVPVPNVNDTRMVRARERSMTEILQRRREVLAELRAMEDFPPPAPRPPESAGGQQKRNQRNQLEILQRELGELDVEWAARPALALGCFFFALIGCPVAIWFQKRDYLSNFVTCFLPIVLVNYPLVMMAMQLGKADKLDPNLGMWIGNGVLGGVGVLLLRWVGRH